MTSPTEARTNPKANNSTSVANTVTEEDRSISSTEHNIHSNHHRKQSQQSNHNKDSNDQSLQLNLNAKNKNGPMDSTRPTKLQQQLLERAASVRQKLGSVPPLHNLTDHDLFVPSKYWQSQEHNNNNDGNGNTATTNTIHSINERGFCNWLVPGKIMIGQYPGQNPLHDGPSKHEVQRHLQSLCCHHGICLFCSLQSETPAQDCDEQWGNDGKVYLTPERIRKILPRPFTQYAPIARELMSKVQHDCPPKEPIFIHAPIEDLNVPASQEPLQQLLLQLLEFLDEDPQEEEGRSNHQTRGAAAGGGAMYIHCWGGRGRAALVGACLVSLIWPCLDANRILDWVQRGYATRLGHETMTEEFAYSPQTPQQRQFVTHFVQEYQQLLTK